MSMHHDPMSSRLPHYFHARKAKRNYRRGSRFYFGRNRWAKAEGEVVLLRSRGSAASVRRSSIEGSRGKSEGGWQRAIDHKLTPQKKNPFAINFFLFHERIGILTAGHFSSECSFSTIREAEIMESGGVIET
nr:hypothetical protein Iba_chr11bCG17460 [Ipomoea batatas]GMD59176.1 hypothetical protein Iba_chr11fCG12640 [Ipomoea batatas]